jgi:hypothetical protein
VVPLHKRLPVVRFDDSPVHAVAICSDGNGGAPGFKSRLLCGPRLGPRNPLAAADFPRYVKKNIFFVKKDKICLSKQLKMCVVSGSIYLNGKNVSCDGDVREELRKKQHDLICPITYFSSISPFISNRGCVCGFEGMTDGKYESARSQELAFAIHVDKMKNGILDLEPLRQGITFVGIGVVLLGLGGLGLGLGLGLGHFVKALKTPKVIVRARKASKVIFLENCQFLTL